MSSLGENSSPIKAGAAISSGSVSLDGGDDGGEIASPGPVFANVGGTPYMLALELNGSTLITPFSTQLVAYNLQTHQQMWSKQLPGQGGQALALSSDVVYVASATIDRAYPSPSQRHFWLTMMDLRSGQVARQLQNNDSSFRMSQLLGDDGRLFVAGPLCRFRKQINGLCSREVRRALHA